MNSDINIKPLPKVILRAMEPEDLDLIYGIENDQDIWSVSNTNMPYSRFALHEYIASSTGDIYTDKQIRLIITNSHSEFIGIIDLCNFSPQHQRAEVGIVIQQKYRDMGYGQAALMELMDYSHVVLHIHQLFAIVSIDNVYCVKLFEKVGFERDAELKEWLFDGDEYHNVYLMHFFCKKMGKSFVK